MIHQVHLSPPRVVPWGVSRLSLLCGFDASQQCPEPAEVAASGKVTRKSWLFQKWDAVIMCCHDCCHRCCWRSSCCHVQSLPKLLCFQSSTTKQNIFHTTALICFGFCCYTSRFSLLARNCASAGMAVFMVVVSQGTTPSVPIAKLLGYLGQHTSACLREEAKYPKSHELSPVLDQQTILRLTGQLSMTLRGNQI